MLCSSYIEETWMYRLLTTRRVALGVSNKKKVKKRIKIKINPDNQVCELPFFYFLMCPVLPVSKQNLFNGAIEDDVFVLNNH